MGPFLRHSVFVLRQDILRTNSRVSFLGRCAVLDYKITFMPIKSFILLGLQTHLEPMYMYNRRYLWLLRSSTLLVNELGNAKRNNRFWNCASSASRHTQRNFLGVFTWRQWTLCCRLLRQFGTVQSRCRLSCQSHRSHCRLSRRCRRCSGWRNLRRSLQKLSLPAQPQKAK